MFPPQDESEQPVDIRDPWSAPQTFAEDLYTGGEVLGDTSQLSPSHLTPAMSTPQVDEGIAISPGVLTPLALDVIEPSDPSIQSDRAEEISTSEQAFVQLPGAEAEQETFDIGLLDDLYAEIGNDVPASPTEDALDVNQLSYPASGVNSVEEQSPRPILHDRSTSPPRASLKGHIDWNWPPAFHGQPLVELTSQEAPTPIMPLIAEEEHQEAAPKPVPHEVVEISDDEAAETAPSNPDIRPTNIQPHASNDVSEGEQADELHGTPSFETNIFLPNSSIQDGDAVVQTREDG